MKELNNIMDKIGIDAVHNKNVLFLQGPMGPFFNNFSTFIRNKYNANVHNISYNGGDEYFLKDYIPIIGSNLELIEKSIKLIKDKNIQIVFLFGDERLIHASITKWIRENDNTISIYAFEEGYFRPNYITIEKDGVNNNSTLDLSYKALQNMDLNNLIKDYKQPIDIGKPYSNMAWYATIYYFQLMIKKFKYPFYIHHRDASLIKEGYYGLCNFIKLKYNKIVEKKYTMYITNDISNNFIFFPLQVESDFQIKKHSPFNNIEESIHEFFRLYKKYNTTEYIVIKHHPMDRGKNDYKRIIKINAEKFNIDANKIIYIYDVDLPTCLTHAKKCITVNSTVGISALIHELPVFLMGKANYNIKNITNTELEFFTSYKKPDMELFKKLKFTIINKTQSNGSFYKEI